MECSMYLQHIFRNSLRYQLQTRLDIPVLDGFIWATRTARNCTSPFVQVLQPCIRPQTYRSDCAPGQALYRHWSPHSTAAQLRLLRAAVAQPLLVPLEAGRETRPPRLKRRECAHLAGFIRRVHVGLGTTYQRRAGWCRPHAPWNCTFSSLWILQHSRICTALGNM
jgi:hypothetical protein